MQSSQLLRRNLIYYWRTNLAVVLGVATAVAVLAGALLVGNSVRESLRDLFVERLGNTDYVIASQSFFREQLAADIQNDQQFATSGFAAACPLIALEGTVSHEASRRVGAGIKVYGIDDRFWKFQRQEGKQSPKNREVLVSESLARELGTNVGDSIVLRVQKPSEIPVESLHGRKDDLGSTLRLTVRETLAADGPGDFSLQPQQSAVRAVFVPLNLLQKEFDQPEKANLILLSETSHDKTNGTTSSAKTELLSQVLRERSSLEDFGLKLRVLAEQQSISLEHDSNLLNDSLAESALAAANRLTMRARPVLSYLANSISKTYFDEAGHSSKRSIPYSLVTALDKEAFAELRRGDKATGGNGDGETRGRGDTGTGIRRRSEKEDRPVSTRLRVPASPPAVPPSKQPPIILNEWAARDLGVSEGSPISLEYYLWHEGGRLETKTSQFQLAGVVPIKGIAADRDLVPEYPGITGSESLSDWDPPFPVDLKRVRKQDEDYWKQYRTTPKAFIPLSAGQGLWQSRFGKLTSLRLSPPSGMPLRQAAGSYGQQLKTSLDPARMGLNVVPVRQQGLEASRGATDFGEYFLYFSFFLVISALLLAALFFKLGIEQRLREIGLLQAMGFPPSRIRALFLAEGMILASIGSVIGLVGAVGYGRLMMLGLRTWWVDAVGTTMLSLHVSPLLLLLGAAGGTFAALLCVVWTLRGLGKESTRSLLTDTLGRDWEPRGQGDTGTRRHGDAGTRGQGDTGTRRHGDAGRGGTETRGCGDTATGGQRDTRTRTRVRRKTSPCLRVPASPRLPVFSLRCASRSCSVSLASCSGLRRHCIWSVRSRVFSGAGRCCWPLFSVTKPHGSVGAAEGRSFERDGGP